MTTLRIRRTHFPVTALGPGRRFGVWVQGCPLACTGCMSLDTWNPDEGTTVDIEILVEEWREALADGANGLTVSGGEPLAQPEGVRTLLEGIRRTRGGADILLYTGYEPEEFTPAARAAADLADVLVTGRFDATRPTDLVWRGSANQRMSLQTDLGRRRYAAYVEHAPERAPLQVVPEPDGVVLIGTPRRGTLPRLERLLRRRGLDLNGVTWRPRS